MSPARVKCPTCQRDLDWEAAPFRPFCSERCRLIDLGAWLTEQRSIPGDTTATHGETGTQPPPRGSTSDE
ncbi:MAG TPA: DNA gyrase inhibitor YacG [Burkholderiales bacterium]|nr:DNA gyrase inhibitor YacG [Burkholderiales bacterium]